MSEPSGSPFGRWVASGAIAAVIYGAAAVAVVVLLKSQRPPEREREVEVTFARPPAVAPAPPVPSPEPPPPPPPPPPPAIRPPKVTSVKPPRPVAVPTEVPREAPPEADPATVEPTGNPGADHGVLGGTGTGAPAVADPPSPPKPAGPVELPQGATPPRASADNAAPEYPERARAGGREGEVILRVVITEGGKVTRIQVLHGDEPFVAAAVDAVKTWSYSPATQDGHPIAVIRILKIPFRLSGGP